MRSVSWRILTVVLITLFVVSAVAAQPPRQKPTADSPYVFGNPSSWQWIYSVYFDASSAHAAAAAGANDSKPPIVIVTGDPLAPWVVFRWSFADLWYMAPSFTCEVLPLDEALNRFPAYRSATPRRSGLTTMPDGDAIVWMTH